MGKKSGKGKEKKLKRKEQQARIAAAVAAVARANEVEDPMASLTAFRRFSRNGLTANVECVRTASLPEKDQDWAFTLTKDNMQDSYERNGWGWRDREKREELLDERAWFIISRHSETNEPLGFVNFRFDVEEGIEVAYCYEVHIIAGARRKGLGRFMMQLLQLIAHKGSMLKVMATVFKDNVASMRFFIQSLKFDYDESSPSVCDPEDASEHTYEILSKEIRPANKQAAPGAQPVSKDATAKASSSASASASASS